MSAAESAWLIGANAAKATHAENAHVRQPFVMKKAFQSNGYILAEHSQRLRNLSLKNDEASEEFSPEAFRQKAQTLIEQSFEALQIVPLRTEPSRGRHPNRLG